MSFEIKTIKSFNIQQTPGVKLGKCEDCKRTQLVYLTKCEDSTVDLCKKCKTARVLKCNTFNIYE
jgi:hypothetical protein